MAFVVSDGRLGLSGTAPSGWTPGPLLPLGMQLSASTYADFGFIWRRQPQVRTVVSFLARNIAQLGLHTFRRVSDTDRERLADHPMAVLLANPAPGSGITRYRLIERLVSDQAIYDIAFWAKVRAAGRLALVPLPVERVQPEGGNWLSPQRYRVYNPSGPDTELDAADVVVFHGYNPVDPRVGASPLESLRSVLLEEFEAAQNREQMWRSGARIGGVLKRPAEAPKWSPEAFERFRESWGTYARGGGREGGTPILEDGMEYQQLAMTPAQAQYIEARKLTREEVASAYHIPLPMVGILDHATFSNIKEQHQQLYQDTLGPWLTSISEDIALQLLPEFPDSDDVYVEFNMAEKMRGSFDDQANAASKSTGRPWMTVNETRARFNLPQVDGGDDLTVPMNVAVGGLASPADTASEDADRPPKAARPRRGRKADPPDELGGFEEERDAFADALAAASAREIGRLAGADDTAGLLAAWDAGAKGRVAVIQQVAAAYGFRLSQVGAWQVLEKFNPDADGWDADVMLAWIMAAAETHATQHDEAGRAALEKAVAEGDGVPGTVKAAAAVWVVDAARRATTASTEFRSFGGYDAAGASGLVKKVWRTGGKNPRASHKALNGEEVSLDDVFGNGLRWPGDGKGDTKEVANCRCRLDYTRG
jgi:HK97 family phage portal protein